MYDKDCLGLQDLFSIPALASPPLKGRSCVYPTPYKLAQNGSCELSSSQVKWLLWSSWFCLWNLARKMYDQCVLGQAAAERGTAGGLEETHNAWRILHQVQNLTLSSCAALTLFSSNLDLTMLFREQGTVGRSKWMQVDRGDFVIRKYLMHTSC